MGMAPVAHVLFNKFMTFNPENPDWVNRDPQWIHLAWAVAALVALWIVLELRSRDALGRFLSPLMQARLVVRASMARTIVRLALIGVALGACVWALMRPQTRGQDQAVMASQFSADVMIVLDVSKSMLAEDVAPNRLARAKAEIAEMVRQLRGHRVGLVAFAGRAALLCPLTADHSFFNLVLRGVDVNSVSRGGTRIGEALRVATAGFPTGPGAKLLVLITDGEDHESYPLEAAKKAKGEGVKIVAVGLGSESGSPIVLTDPRTGAKTQQTHDGQPVITRLDGDTLHIDLWLMSCRVLKKDMEFAMLDEVVAKAKEQGIGRIVGYYFPTAKNNMVRDLYGKFGFTKVSEDEEGNTVWELLTENYQVQNHVIRINGGDLK
jgi:Ca-activated chloride channel family protein